MRLDIPLGPLREFHATGVGSSSGARNGTSRRLEGFVRPGLMTVISRSHALSDLGGMKSIVVGVGNSVAAIGRSGFPALLVECSP